MKILFPGFFRKSQRYHVLSNFLIIVILFIATTSDAFGQADTCSKPKVAVQFTELWNQAVDLLNSKGISQSKASWKYQIQGNCYDSQRINSRFFLR